LFTNFIQALTTNIFSANPNVENFVPKLVIHLKRSKLERRILNAYRMNMFTYYAFYTLFKTGAVVCTLYTPDTVFRTVNRFFCDFYLHSQNIFLQLWTMAAFLILKAVFTLFFTVSLISSHLINAATHFDLSTFISCQSDTGT